MGEIVPRRELEKLVSGIRNKGKTIATTNGAFDIIHAGHIKSLKAAKEKADILIVGLNSDASIKKYKSKKRPIIHEEERAIVLSAISVVDYVVIFDEETPCNLLETIRPDVHVKGSEYKEDMPEKAIVERYGGRVIFIERGKKDVSTTMIIKRIQESGE